jgi:hypothetical protein
MSYNTDPNEFKVCPYDSSHRISMYIYIYFLVVLDLRYILKYSYVLVFF